MDLCKNVLLAAFPTDNQVTYLSTMLFIPFGMNLA
jgi:hypothetical protein